MSETQSSLTERISKWNENGQLYLGGGVISVLIAWFLVPPVGLISVWLAYQLYIEHERTMSSALIGTLGGLAVVLWLGILAGIV